MTRELTLEEKKRQDALLEAEEKLLQEKEKSRAQDALSPMSEQMRAAQQKMRTSYKQPNYKYVHADAHKGELEKQAIKKTSRFEELSSGAKAESTRETALITEIDEQRQHVSSSLQNMKAKLDTYETYLQDKSDPVAQEKKAIISTMKTEINSFLEITKKPARTRQEIASFYKSMGTLNSLATNDRLSKLSEARTKKEHGILATIKLCIMDLLGRKPKGEIVAKELKEREPVTDNIFKMYKKTYQKIVEKTETDDKKQQENNSDNAENIRPSV